MRKVLLLSFLFLWAIHAQSQIKPDCQKLLNEGDTLINRSSAPLGEALKKYLLALNCDSKLAGSVSPKIQNVFDRIKVQQDELSKSLNQLKKNISAFYWRDAVKNWENEEPGYLPFRLMQEALRIDPKNDSLQLFLDNFLDYASDRNFEKAIVYEWIDSTKVKSLTTLVLTNNPQKVNLKTLNLNKLYGEDLLYNIKPVFNELGLDRPYLDDYNFFSKDAFTYSPNGQFIAILVQGEKRPELHLFDLEKNATLLKKFDSIKISTSYDEGLVMIDFKDHYRFSPHSNFLAFIAKEEKRNILRLVNTRNGGDTIASFPGIALSSRLETSGSYDKSYAFSPDESCLTFMTRNGKNMDLNLYDIHSGDVRKLPFLAYAGSNPERIYIANDSYKFGTTGNLLAVLSQESIGNKKTLQILDVSKKKMPTVLLIHNIIYSDHEKYTKAGQGVISFDNYGNDRLSKSFTFSPNGKSIAALSEDGNGPSLRVFNLESTYEEQIHIKNLLPMMGLYVGVNNTDSSYSFESSYQFSPNGKYIAAYTGSQEDSEIKVFDCKTGNQIFSSFKLGAAIKNDSLNYFSFNFSTDSRYFLLITNKGDSMRVEIFDVIKDSISKKIGISSQTTNPTNLGFGFSPKCNFFYESRGKEIVIYGLKNTDSNFNLPKYTISQFANNQPRYLLTSQFSPDSAEKYLLLCNYSKDSASVDVFNSQSGNLITHQEIMGYPSRRRDYESNISMEFSSSFKFSPTGRYIALLKGKLRYIEIYDLQTGALIRKIKHQAKIDDFLFLPNLVLN